MSATTACRRCSEAQPLPNGARRECSFPSDGLFRNTGLNCATFNTLNLWTACNGQANETWDDGQAVQVFAHHGKFLIVGRYHSKPYRTESCIIIDGTDVDVMPRWQDVEEFISALRVIP